MDFIYKKAGMDNIELLTQLRLEVIRTTSRLAYDTDLSEVLEETRRYNKNHFEKDLHAAWLVYAGEYLAGAGGITFYQVMPTYYNPSGKRACIMNLYLNPDFSSEEFTLKLLDRLCGCTSPCPLAIVNRTRVFCNTDLSNQKLV